MSEERPALGSYLRAQRHAQEKSLQDVATDAMSVAYLSQLETNKIQNPKVSRLLQVADSYEISVFTILSEVFGVKPETDIDPEACRIGQAVMSLSEKRRKDVISWIYWSLAHDTAPIPYSEGQITG